MRIKRSTRALAGLLAVILLVTGITFPEPLVTEAADTCACYDLNHSHMVEGSIADWCKKGNAGWDVITKWGKSDDKNKNVHVIQMKSTGTMYLAWYQQNKKATNLAHYHTDGYHFTKNRYSLGGSSIVMGNPDCFVMEGNGSNQAEMGFVPGSSTEIYTLYWVNYNKIIKYCRDLKLSLKRNGKECYYLAYLQPYISCFNGNGTQMLKAGNNYNLVHDWFVRLFSKATQEDLKEKYNVPIKIPAYEIPIKLRYWERTGKGDDGRDVRKLYNANGEHAADTGETAVVWSVLETNTKKRCIQESIDGILASMNAKRSKEGNYRLLQAAQKLSTRKIENVTEFKENSAPYIFSGLSVTVSDNNTTPEYEYLRRVLLNGKEMLKADEVKKSDYFGIVYNNLGQDSGGSGGVTTPQQLFDSLKRSCETKRVFKRDSNGDKALIDPFSDTCYIDVYYVASTRAFYDYQVVQSVADYDTKTGKFTNAQELGDLIQATEIKEANKTADGKLTFKIAKQKYPDYALSEGEKALGSVIKDGHKYVIAQSRLSVTAGTDKPKNWNNVSDQVESTSWCGSYKYLTAGNNYAYNTTALNSKLKNYRHFTDSAKMSSYGDAATWTVNNLYVCRPPLIQLNYKYDKTTETYQLIDTVPASLATSDDLTYEFANNNIEKQIYTYKSGLPLQQIKVGTGYVKPYDGSNSFTQTGCPVLMSEVTKKNLKTDDRKKTTIDLNFTMPYDTTFIVCVYGDVPKDQGEFPGYTRVILDHVGNKYTVRESKFIPADKSTSTSANIIFDKEDLVDVGYSYADKNNPTIPKSYNKKPTAKWGSKSKTEYDYTGPDTPGLNRNLIVYAVYEVTNPGYTEVLLVRDLDTNKYSIQSVKFKSDTDPYAKKVTVQFTPARLEDVGYTYASTNRPDITCDGSKPSASWGQKNPVTLDYTNPTFPELNQNLIVYAVYMRRGPVSEGKQWEDTWKIEGHRPAHTPGDDSSKTPLDPQDEFSEDMEAFIKNDYKASTSKDYDTEIAIPTSEYENTYATVKKYVATIDQTKHTAHFQIDVTVHDSHYVMTRYGPVYVGYCEHTFTIERTTTYYTLDDGATLTPADMTWFNKTLTLEEQVTAKAANKYWENGELGFQMVFGAERILPTYRTYTSTGGIGCRGMAALRALAEGCVGQYKSHNDVVEFGNGEGSVTQLSDAVFRVDNPQISEAPEAEMSSLEEGERVFDKWGVFIPADRENQEYKSKATVHYKTYHSTAGSKTHMLFGVRCNPVVIDTPVVSNCYLVTEEDKVQKLTKSADKNLVLDTHFKVHCDAIGTHANYPGYGTRDYKKWLYTDVFDDEPIKAMQVKFPFPVMRHSEKLGVDTYFIAGSWIAVPVGDTEFYVPSWNDEIDLTAVRWRAISENTEVLSSYSSDDGRTLLPTDQINSKVYLDRLEKVENYANVTSPNYVAWTEELCSVSGRIYQMEITDVTDYPTWETVFRSGNANNPNELSGFSYKSGLLNRDRFSNGAVSETTFPMVKGSNRYDRTAGAVKPGYGIRYRFETVGMLEDSDDQIRITPSFYWISEDGRTRKSVDVYYTETFGGKEHQLVKIGSDLDKTNRHILTMGDEKFGIDQDAIDRTAKARNYENAKVLMDKKELSWCPSLTVLKANMNTFDGTEHKTILSDGTAYNWADLKNAVVRQNDITGITSTDILGSVQDWYGMYYLPSEIYVTDKGTVIGDYLKTEFTGEEACWHQDGYLVINFDFVTVDGGKDRLTYNCYDHPQKYAMGSATYTGTCNMWDREKFICGKVDSDGAVFDFKHGDIFMYELGSGSANTDYTSGGTH